MFRENVAYSTIFSFLVAFVLVMILSSIYASTKALVSENQEKEIVIATLQALGLEVEKEIDPPLDRYQELFGKSPSEVDEIEEISVDGKNILVAKFHGMGLWDYISGILAVDSDLERIIGLRIIAQKETPGLGGRISEESFQRQFFGEKIDDIVRMRPSGSGSGDGDLENSSFDGISGATLTSGYFETIVNDTLGRLRKEKNL